MRGPPDKERAAPEATGPRDGESYKIYLHYSLSRATKPPDHDAQLDGFFDRLRKRCRIVRLRGGYSYVVARIADPENSAPIAVWSLNEFTEAWEGRRLLLGYDEFGEIYEDNIPLWFCERGGGRGADSIDQAFAELLAQGGRQ